MTDLGELADLAEVFGAITIIGGLLFAGIQIRQARLQRQESASLTLVNSYLQDPRALEALRRVSMLPDDWHEQRGYTHDPETMLHVDRLHTIFDTTGFMVHERAVRLEHVARHQGDAIVALWWKLKPYALKERARQGRSGPFEWTEWLVDRLEQYHRVAPRRGAFEEYRHWRP